MTDEDPDAGHDFATLVQDGLIPIWPNLPDVPTEQRRRAWCLATALETIPPSGKPTELAKNVVAVAVIFEDFICESKRNGLKLVKE